MWYAAHAIFLFEFKDGDQNEFSIWDNVYLIDANSSHTAYKKAELFAKKDEGDDDGSLTLNNRLVYLKYYGIRKLITVSNFNANEDIPGDGAEVTFSKYSVKNQSDLKKLVKGCSVPVYFYDE